MGPEERRHVWKLLHAKKRGRVILITSRHVEEADYYAGQCLLRFHSNFLILFFFFFFECVPSVPSFLCTQLYTWCVFDSLTHIFFFISHSSNRKFSWPFSYVNAGRCYLSHNVCWLPLTSPPHLLTHSLAHSPFTHSLSHSLVRHSHSLTRSLAYSLIHSLAHSLTLLCLDESIAQISQGKTSRFFVQLNSSPLTCWLDLRQDGSAEHGTTALRRVFPVLETAFQRRIPPGVSCLVLSLILLPSTLPVFPSFSLFFLFSLDSLSPPLSLSLPPPVFFPYLRPLCQSVCPFALCLFLVYLLTRQSVTWLWSSNGSDVQQALCILTLFVLY